jgi:hypothetical protein
VRSRGDLLASGARRASPLRSFQSLFVEAKLVVEMRAVGSDQIRAAEPAVILIPVGTRITHRSSTARRLLHADRLLSHASPGTTAVDSASALPREPLSNAGSLASRSFRSLRASALMEPFSAAGSAVPVTNCAAGLDSRSTAEATSSALPSRLAGTSRILSFLTSVSPSSIAATMGVWISRGKLR